MEKPEKKIVSEALTIGQDGYFKGWNACHDAMSTWLEGQVKELIQELQRVDHHTVADEIWRIKAIQRKLKGKVT